MRKQCVHSSGNTYRVGVQCLPDLDPRGYVLALLS
jgi:hypothetical protein